MKNQALDYIGFFAFFKLYTQISYGGFLSPSFALNISSFNEDRGLVLVQEHSVTQDL
jgi:hypothetical protein